MCVGVLGVEREENEFVLRCEGEREESEYVLCLDEMRES